MSSKRGDEWRSEFRFDRNSRGVGKRHSSNGYIPRGLHTRRYQMKQSAVKAFIAREKMPNCEFRGRYQYPAAQHDDGHAAQPVVNDGLLALRSQGETLSIFPQNLIEFWALWPHVP